MLEVPVAMLVFNRPDLTRRVFDEVRRQRPPRLLVVADGPRSEHEAPLCAATRSIFQDVDWDCEVLTNLSDVNLGCKQRVSSGLDWVFEQCEEAIILEDDCLPHPSFFRYCSELLEHYRHDPRITMISGDNFLPGQAQSSASYYFSRYCHVWGWASWRRAWQHYDLQMASWPRLRNTPWLLELLGDVRAAAQWRANYEQAHAGCVDTWDYQWVYACWKQNGLAIAPRVNLVSNIGFAEGGTHTTHGDHPLACLPTEDIGFPLRHPTVIGPDRVADMREFELETGAKPPTWQQRLQWNLFRSLPRSLRAPLYHLRGRERPLGSA